MSEQPDALADLVQKINAAVAGVEAAGKALSAAQEAASALVADGSPGGGTDSGGGEESTDGATDGGMDAGSGGGGGSQAPGGGGSVDPYALKFNQYGPPLDGSYFNLVIRPERGSDCDPWGNPDKWWQGIAQQVADAGMTDRGDARIAVVLPPDFPAEATAPYMPHVMGELWLMGDFTDAPRPHLRRGRISFGRSRVAGAVRLDLEGAGATWRGVPGVGMYVTEDIFVGECQFTDYPGDGTHQGFWGRDAARDLFGPDTAPYVEIMDCRFRKVGKGNQKHGNYNYNIGPKGQRDTDGRMRFIRCDMAAMDGSHAIKAFTKDMEIAYCTLSNFDPGYPGVYGEWLIDSSACGRSDVHHNRFTLLYPDHLSSSYGPGIWNIRARRDNFSCWLPWEVDSSEFLDASNWAALAEAGPLDPSHPAAMVHRFHHNSAHLINAASRPGLGFNALIQHEGTFPRTNAPHDPKSYLSLYHEWQREGEPTQPGQVPRTWQEYSMLSIGKGNVVTGTVPGKLFELGLNTPAYGGLNDDGSPIDLGRPGDDRIPRRQAFFEDGAQIEVHDIEGAKHQVGDVATATANARA